MVKVMEQGINMSLSPSVGTSKSSAFKGVNAGATAVDAGEQQDEFESEYEKRARKRKPKAKRRGEMPKATARICPCRARHHCTVPVYPTPTPPLASPNPGDV